MILRPCVPYVSAKNLQSNGEVLNRLTNKPFQFQFIFFKLNSWTDEFHVVAVGSTIQWVSRAPWCLRWVGTTEALGEVTLHTKSQRQLWTVRFSVLIWRWPSCHLSERTSVKRSTLMVQRRWKPACRCWSGFAERAVEVRRTTAATWLTHDGRCSSRVR